MRILLDESLPRRLRKELPGHTVLTVTECGWSGLDNGTLLRAAAVRFDVFLTADQNLEFQQNLNALPLAVIVLVAPRNTYWMLRPLMANVLNCLQQLAPHSLVRISYQQGRRAQ